VTGGRRVCDQFDTRRTDQRTATYTVSQADINNCTPLNNTASVNGTSNCGPASNTSNQVSVNVAGTRCLSITKVANQTQVTTAGQIIGYTYNVTNCGTTTLTG